MGVDVSIVLAGLEGVRSVLLVDKKEGGCLGEFEGHILSSQRFSSRKSSMAFCSFRVRG